MRLVLSTYRVWHQVAQRISLPDWADTFILFSKRECAHNFMTHQSVADFPDFEHLTCFRAIVYCCLSIKQVYFWGSRTHGGSLDYVSEHHP